MYPREVGRYQNAHRKVFGIYSKTILALKVQREIINIETSKFTAESVLTPCPVQGYVRAHSVVICIGPKTPLSAPLERNATPHFYFRGVCVRKQLMVGWVVARPPQIIISNEKQTLDDGLNKYKCIGS